MLLLIVIINSKTLLQLPRSSLPPFTNPSLQDIIMTSSSVAAYDHLNFPLQPPNGTLLGVEDQNETNQGVNLMYVEENNNLDNGLNCKGRGSKKRKVFPTERERRLHFKDRFGDLNNLIPNPTKIDRASIVGEAIDYITELLRTIEEFKLLVEKKRIVKQRNGEGYDDVVVDENFKAQSEVVEQCSKIGEGSSFYANAIADRVMEVLEKQYTEALSTTNGYHCYSSD